MKRNNLSKMISGATSCFPNNVSQGSHIYAAAAAATLSDHVVSSSLEPISSGSETTYSNSLLYSLSILKEKVHQVQSLVMTSLVCPGQAQPPDSTAIAIANMGSLIQEIMVTASSLMFTFQQLGMSSTTTPSTHNHELHHHRAKISIGGEGFYPGETLEDWYGDAYDNITCDTNNDNMNNNIKELSQREENNNQDSPKSYDIIELDAADLLAKYTHYCQVCGKGFKRDANLRMHMRAHGDEYKSSAALSNPMKNKNNNSTSSNSGSAIGEGEEGTTTTTVELPRKYSCPQEGCRWNRKHAKFQPLKSMICVKNHYKRSHCPKMYVCKRCNRKQFSVLSDLRTHEKHCGDLKWQCSCGTTFSRKDKLMGHVALFVGHAPAINCSAKIEKLS